MPYTFIIRHYFFWTLLIRFPPVPIYRALNLSFRLPNQFLETNDSSSSIPLSFFDKCLRFFFTAAKPNKSWSQSVHIMATIYFVRSRTSCNTPNWSLNLSAVFAFVLELLGYFGVIFVADTLRDRWYGWHLLFRLRRRSRRHLPRTARPIVHNDSAIVIG